MWMPGCDCPRFLLSVIVQAICFIFRHILTRPNSSHTALMGGRNYGRTRCRQYFRISHQLGRGSRRANGVHKSARQSALHRNVHGWNTATTASEMYLPFHQKMMSKIVKVIAAWEHEPIIRRVRQTSCTRMSQFQIGWFVSRVYWLQSDILTAFPPAQYHVFRFLFTYLLRKQINIAVIARTFWSRFKLRDSPLLCIL